MGDSDSKKDLTGILELEPGPAPKDSEGFLSEAPPVEQIDSFESLDDYAKHTPAAEPPPEPALEPATEAPAETPHETAAEPAIAGLNDPTPSSEGEGLLSGGGEDPGTQNQDFITTPDSTPPADGGGFSGIAGLDLDPFADSTPLAAPEPEPIPEPAPAPEPLAMEPPAPAKPTETPAQTAPPAAPKTPLQKVRDFSENVRPGKPAVAAAYPFSLLIEGRLTTLEQEKLTDLLDHHEMGIRRVDLEPQLAAGRILIPRISEYAGVLLVQALRGAKARIKLGPSETIFAKESTRDDDGAQPLVTGGQHFETAVAGGAEGSHAAEDMPVTALSALPDNQPFDLLDVITATATLKSSVIEAQRSTEYQELLDALQRELKYKAYRRGADAILGFSVIVTQLSLPTHYRIVVQGSAVKTRRTATPGVTL